MPSVQNPNGTIQGVVPRPRAGRASQYTYDEFESIPTCHASAGYGSPTGTTGDVNVIVTADNKFEYHIKGTQTIVAPTFDANGLNIAMDQTDNDGVEITQGITARSKSAFTIGTDAFYFAVTMKLADVSGSDDCAVGFRKTAAYTAAIDDYTDFAVLNVISGAINIETALNNGATTTTNTTDTWADAATKTLKVIVSKTGAVTYQIDGAAPTATAAFTFDSGDVVIPFVYFLHASDVMDTLYITKWECGLL